MKAQTRTEYQVAWNNHIDLLNSVACDCISTHTCEEIESLIKRMKELVTEASYCVDFSDK